jgi:hypothetical protein
MHPREVRRTPQGQITRRCQIVVAAFVAAFITCAIPSIAQTTVHRSVADLTASTPAQRQQQCVDRWNAQHIWFWARSLSPAQVSAAPCRVIIPYGQPDNGNYFPCSLNQHGAFECATHAWTPADGSPSRKWNAKLHIGGKLTLDVPPHVRLAKKWPRWMRVYAVKNGYIVPFDAAGRVRPGIVIKPPGEGGSWIEACTSGGGKYGTMLSCVASTTCFAPRLPVAAGASVACAFGPDGGPGSTRFAWATVVR